MTVTRGRPLARCFRDDRGSVATEHVLLIVAIALVAMAAMFVFGNAVLHKFDKPNQCVASGTLPGCS